MIRFIDLFAGIGVMRLGFQQACDVLGIESQCVLSSEIDKRAIETYKLNFELLFANGTRARGRGRKRHVCVSVPKECV